MLLVAAPNVRNRTVISLSCTDGIVNNSHCHCEARDENVPVHLSGRRVLVQWEEREDKCQG
jgi:hypothetical protein